MTPAKKAATRRSRSGRRVHIALVAAVTAISLTAALAPAGAWARGPQPDLRPTAVRSPAWADPVDTFTASVTVVNRGTGASSKTALHFYLSSDKTLSASDGRLGGSAPVPGLRAGRSVTTHPVLRLPSGARPGQFWLLACVSGHCAPSGQKVHVTATPMTSTKLIDRARLSKGTKVVYKVYAALGDPRLPNSYRGDNPPLYGDLALRDARAQWPVLTTGERALIRPYLQPPSGPQGWATPALSSNYASNASTCEHRGPRRMKYVDSPGNRIRIWYEDTSTYDAKIAPGLAQAAATIYTKFVNLTGRKLPSDAGVCGFNGGDGHYDVYILDPTEFANHWKGFAITGDYYKGGGPAFTYFSSAPDKVELAHELFHAFQFTYKHAAPIGSYAGFDEGSANWAANYVYPGNYLGRQEWTMLTYPDGAGYTFPDNNYGYELWVFDLYLTEKFGDQLIPQIYQEFQHEDELTALNSVIPGGFADRLAEFTRYGWNQTPVRGGFRTWDELDQVPWVQYQQPVRPMKLHLGDLESRTLNLPDKLAPLTRDYMPLHVDDQHIHDLLFRNTVKGIQGASVQAFVKLNNGTWKTQDWTNKKSVEFCRDNGPDQDVTDLVIMYDNARYQDKKPLNPSKQPTLELRNNCDRYYRVTKVTGSYHEQISVPDTSHAYPCTDSGTEDFSLTIDPNGHLATTDGSYTPHGIGDVYVPAQLTGSRHYQQACTGGDPFLQSCNATLSAPVAYMVGIGDAFTDTDPVPLQVPNPRHQDPFDEACDDQGYGWFNSDNPQYMDPTSVSRSALEGTAAFTISASNTYDDGAGRTYSTSLTITLQPTDKTGQPLQ